MLEWYRAGAPYTALMDDCADILRLAAEVAGSRTLRFRGREADAFAAPERLSVADAFMRYAGIDLMASLMPQGEPLLAPLLLAARGIGIRVAPDDHWSTFSAAFSRKRSNRTLALAAPQFWTAIRFARRRWRGLARMIPA